VRLYVRTIEKAREKDGGFHKGCSIRCFQWREPYRSGESRAVEQLSGRKDIEYRSNAEARSLRSAFGLGRDDRGGYASVGMTKGCCGGGHDWFDPALLKLRRAGRLTTKRKHTVVRRRRIPLPRAAGVNNAGGW